MHKQKKTHQQLPLILPVEASNAREDLIVTSSNRLAVDLIDHWPDWPSHMVVIVGPRGSGKSHLTQIWARRAGANICNGNDLAGCDQQANTIAIENIGENVDNGPLDEAALFHLFNRTRAAQGHMLITSRHLPSVWGIKLPDLASRIKTVHLVELAEPDDLLLGGVIAKLFADRQMEVKPAIVTYLVQRMERSLATANRIVDWLDHAALSRRVKITRPLAEEALAVLEQNHDEGE